MDTSINIKPIGTVKEEQGSKWIEILPEYCEGLSGLEQFSHVVVTWWGHLSVECRGVLTTNKPYRNGPDSVGVFGTRAEFRPNPILVTVIHLTSQELSKGRLDFSYIDAEGGSPVLDLKPYMPCSDLVSEASVASWCSDWPVCYEDSADFDWESIF